MHLTPRLVFFLVLPPLLWAGNAVVGRLAIGSMDPLWLNAVRWMLAFVLLLPFSPLLITSNSSNNNYLYLLSLRRPRLVRIRCRRRHRITSSILG